MSSNFNQWLGPKNEQEVNNILRLRTFRAYIEVVDKSEIVEKIANCKAEFKDDMEPDGKSIFDVIGFNLSSSFDDIPKCSISVPSGKIVANMYQSPDINKIVKAKTEEFKWEPVKAIDTYPRANREKIMQQGYRGVILWYQEAWKNADIDQNEENKGKFKQIFKGVITTDAFNRIAHRQESVTITATHWLQLFKVLSMNNLFLNQQTVHSTDVPWLRRLDLEYSENTNSSNKNWGPTLQALWVKRILGANKSNGEIDINKGLIMVMEQHCKLLEDFTPVLESVSGTDGKKLHEVTNNNRELIKKILGNMKNALQDNSSGEEVKFSMPKLTTENCGPNNTPDIAFGDVVLSTGIAKNNNLTFYQFLTNACTQFGLSLVCTANSVSCESLNPRPKKWAKLGPPQDKESDHCISMATAVTGSTPATGEMVAAISHVNLVPPYSNNNGNATSANENIRVMNKDPANMGGGMWGFGVCDPQFTSDNTAFGLTAYVNLPRWYSTMFERERLNQTAKNEEAPKFTTHDGQPDGQSQQAQQSNSGGRAVNKFIDELLLVELFKARTFGHNLRVTMPININIMTGSPVLVMDSTNGYFHSGVIASFAHQLQQTSLLAQTEMTVIWTEPLFSEPTGDNDMSQANWEPASHAPKDNPNGYEQNLLYEKSFTRRGIYE